MSRLKDLTEALDKAGVKYKILSDKELKILTKNKEQFIEIYAHLFSYRIILYTRSINKNQDIWHIQYFIRHTIGCVVDKVKQLIGGKQNEGTAYPYWIIIDPAQNLSTKKEACYNIASMITGGWFSREAAEEYLNNHKYNFGENAVVFCASGHASCDYVEAIKKGVNNGETKIKK